MWRRNSTIAEGDSFSRSWLPYMQRSRKINDHVTTRSTTRVRPYRKQDGNDWFRVAMSRSIGLIVSALASRALDNSRVRQGLQAQGCLVALLRSPSRSSLVSSSETPFPTHSPDPCFTCLSATIVVAFEKDMASATLDPPRRQLRGCDYQHRRKGG
ncbi:hypothetical protein BDV96DRAFT_55305 [Lophiotrema nucula]|uniref:Uncharacterized protein n=1 Tax=Lophiotrema nucula TaxID=690887 RepID=A0A6A5Z8H1_9PLEO|nr:hypothetical protein BDV96DRAFT_55305 [Lophiotrema nucula]